MFDSRAIVIGSGFGGGIAALRLGQAGIDTIVLERGRRWPIQDPTRNSTFATFENPDGRSTWLSPVTRAPGYDGVPIKIFPGVLEVLKEDGITVLTGAGVGGGTLVYQGVLIQPPRHLFKQIFPASVDYDEMDKVYFPRVRSILQPAGIPDDILATDYYACGRVTKAHAIRAGFPFREKSSEPGDGCVKMELNVDWGAVREEIAGKRVPSAIAGQHWYGNNSGAKQSVDRNYLALAQQSGKVEIRPQHVVTGLSQLPGGGYAVSCDVIDDSGATVAEKTLKCQALFLGAGSMGTSKLLVRARAKGSLPNLPESIGQGWGDNGDVFVLRGKLDEITNPHQGGPGSGIAILNYDNPIKPCIMMTFPSARFAEECPEKNALFSGVIVMSPVRGVFRYDPVSDRVRLRFPPDRIAEEAARHLGERLCKAAGGEVLQVATGISAHPLGGACMGTACDDCGRVKGHDRLYVVDSALLPGSTTCVNPALTVAAIAERCLERILARDAIC